MSIRPLLLNAKFISDFKRHFTLSPQRWGTINMTNLHKFRPSGSVVMIQGKRGHRPVIKSFLRLAYLREDPLMMANGLQDSRELLDFWVDEYVVEELTVIAVHSTTGHVLGMAAGTVCREGAADNIKKKAAEKIKDQRAYRMACLFADIAERIKLFERFQVNEAFECPFLATSPRMRRRGLAKYILLHSRALARAGGFPLYRVDCTSHFSSRIAKRLGMEQLPTRQLTDYVDKEGKPWVEKVPPAPHHKLDIYYERLNPSLCTFYQAPPRKNMG